MPQAQQRQDAHEVRYAGRPGTGFVTDAKLVSLFSHGKNIIVIRGKPGFTKHHPREEQRSDPLE